MSASQYEFDSTVQGFHEYQWIWAPVVCKEFPCKHETHNWYDSFVVVVTKYVLCGHWPIYQGSSQQYFGCFTD